MRCWSVCIQINGGITLRTFEFDRFSEVYDHVGDADAACASDSHVCVVADVDVMSVYLWRLM